MDTTLPPLQEKIAHLKRWALIMLIYAVLVILWGAWVRISSSGNGCGNHWPLCNGEAIPVGAHQKTWIEWFHRISSGLFGLFIFYVFFLSTKLFSYHRIKISARLSLIFMISEALLGALLVKAELVADNSSFVRLVVMELHFFNSLCLVASLLFLYEYCGPFLIFRKNELLVEQFKKTLKKIILPVAAVLLSIIATGVIAALANTLFPENSLVAALQNDFLIESHWLVKARIIHPTMGIIAGLLLSAFLWMFQTQLAPGQKFAIARSKHLVYLVFLTVGAGLLTLILHAPILMKLIHLTLIYGLWIAFLRWLNSLIVKAE